MATEDPRTSEDIIKEKLEPLIKEIKERIYDPSYDAPNSEVLGVIIAKMMQWDGVEIFKVFEAALTDSNFHEEADKVSKIREGL